MTFGKYNKFKIGDIVKHNDAPSILFRIIDILISVPEDPGIYLYECSQIIDDEDQGLEEVYELKKYKYAEEDLFLVRNASKEELNQLLREVLGQFQRFARISADIQNAMRE